MKKYKAVFFDLDHTLWDFETNSREAITEIFHKYQLTELGIPGCSEFIETYRRINHRMWNDYSLNLITKEALRAGRFQSALTAFGINNSDLANTMSAMYLQICPVKTNLFPGTKEILQYLSKKYSLHIITNGFKEVQHLKIGNTGLKHFFDQIHISEELGFKKPEPEIFHYAVKMARTVSENCIMIGDNLDTDISGAENAGIDPVFFNPNREQTGRKVFYEISTLEELRKIL